MTKDKFEQMVATLREEYILEPGDRPDIEEFIGYASRGFEPPRPFVQAGEIKEEDWKSARPGLVTFVPPEALRSEYDQAALDEASRELHMFFLREGSRYGTKACEEIGRVFMTAYLKAFPSPLARSQEET